MALALYRKYRPRTFAEVIGQEHVTEPLSQALRTGRLHHAYLFSGPRGCGKTSSARILARSLNCAQGPTPDPCGECESCVALTTDAGSIDVIEIDAASHGGVDDARELRERAVFAPVSSRYKIYVIDEAHMVSSAGFNALLKLVEEPPEFVKFVFATTEPEKVLGTIKSRTHHYPFRLIPPGVLRPFLERLCQQEGVPVEPAVFPLVVRAGGGSARDTLSVLDQLIAGAGAEGVTYARAVALLGVTDVVLIDDMCDALAAGDGAAAFATVDRVVEAGHDPRRFASDLLERLRDLIVLQHVPNAATSGLIDAPSDQLARMQAQASQLGPATLSRCADIVHKGLVEMRGTTAPRLLLELICARMLLPGAEVTSGGLLQRLERMERRLTLAGDSAATVTTATPAVPVATAPPPATAAGPGVPTAPVSAAGPATPSTGQVPPPVAAGTTDLAPGSAAVAPGGLDAAAVRRAWDEILEIAGRKKKAVAAWAREATVRDVDGETLVLLFRYSFHAQSLSAQPEALLEALSEVLGGHWQIRCEVGGDQRAVNAGGDSSSEGRSAGFNRSGGRAGRGAGAAARPATTSAALTATQPGEDWPPAVRPGGEWPPAAQPGAGAATSGSAGPGPRGVGRTATATGQAVAATGQAATVVGQAAAGTGQAAARTSAGRDAARRAAGTHGGSTTRGAGGSGRAGALGRADSAARVAVAGTGRQARTAARTGLARAAGVPGVPGQAGPDADGWSGEPPYDPEYDGPVRGVAAYEGFDPGDEPLDDDETSGTPATRQTSEQQAIQLLQQALGAEEIGEAEVG